MGGTHDSLGVGPLLEEGPLLEDSEAVAMIEDVAVEENTSSFLQCQAGLDGGCMLSLEVEFHKPKTENRYWSECIPWYPDGCFGPYRSNAYGYSRRELAADGATHVIGITLGCVAVVMLIVSGVVHKPPVEVTVALSVYGAGLLCMLCCSAVFNGLAWTKHIWALQLCDHIGILFLIAGSYTPIMTFACCPRTLAFVWVLAVVSMVAKASRSRLDVVQFHVPIFLLMGWSCMAIWKDVVAVLTPWACRGCVVGGILYTVGLVPWAINKLEFHNAIWHVFVLAASACFLAVMYHEISQPSNWQAVQSGTCQANLFGA